LWIIVAGANEAVESLIRDNAPQEKRTGIVVWLPARLTKCVPWGAVRRSGGRNAIKSHMIAPIRNVHLETNTCCNAKCIFCPTPGMTVKTAMSMTLFRKIIDDLARTGFRGKLMPYFRNEPLTDPQIFERLEYVRDRLPAAPIYFSTNGLALRRERIAKLLDLQPVIIKISMPRFSREQSIEVMGVDNGPILENIRALFEEGKKRGIENPQERFKLVMVNAPHSEQFLMRKYFADGGMDGYFQLQCWELVNRAGHVDRGVFGERVFHGRIRGCRQGSPEINVRNTLTIRADGRVVLCCMDWGGEVVLGDMNTQEIREVWEGAKRRDVMAMVEGTVQARRTFLCKRCSKAIPRECFIREAWGTTTGLVLKGCARIKEAAFSRKT